MIRHESADEQAQPHVIHHESADDQPHVMHHESANDQPHVIHHEPADDQPHVIHHGPLGGEPLHAEEIVLQVHRFKNSLSNLLSIIWNTI